LLADVSVVADGLGLFVPKPNENAGFVCVVPPGPVPDGLPKTIPPDLGVSVALATDGCPNVFLAASEPPPNIFFDGSDDD